MAPLSALQRATIQASLLNITSTILAQVLRRYKTTGQFTIFHIEILPILHFLFWCLASTPPNFLWQEYLEARFPGYPVQQGGNAVVGEKEKVKGDDDGKTTAPKRKLDIKNTFTKLAFDQTIGAALNNAGFLVCITLVRGGSWSDAMTALGNEFWPIMIAAWKVWPAVSLFNFLLVPVERRIVVGATVGLFWGIYMVLRVS